MGDRELVASIVAGDPDGLAEAYDRYADLLYKYCQSMLSDPADAADAVQDTFVIAASRLAGLREPERLRAWLYAVARNECLRILRARKTTSALDETSNITDDAADVGDDAERAELRRLFDDAMGGLNPGEREVMELHLRQGLETAEVAAVLGVSRNHAHALLSRAREQLEVCLGILLVGRTGRDNCAELRGMLTGWDGQLTVLLRKRVHRHIERCAACSIRRALELRPAMLLDLSPGAAMAAAAAESLRIAAGPPAELKAHTLALAAGQDPGAIAHRAALAGRAGSFGRHGFPRQPHWPTAAKHASAKHGLRYSPRGQATVAAGVLLAVVIGAGTFALSGTPQHGKLADGKQPGSASLPEASLVASAVASPGKSTAATMSAPTRSATAPTPTLTTTGFSTPSLSATPTTNPTTASPTPTQPATPTPTPTPASPSPTPTPTPTPGTLDVNPAGGWLWIPPDGATITLTAQGGPVTWSTAVSHGFGYVGVSPSSGTLAQGASVTITITASPSASGQQLTIEPGGTVFTILVDHHHGH